MDLSQKDFDVVILGSGPAGLQAAVHAARGKTKVAVLGRVQRSSLFKAHIENYCCMDSTVSGQEILEEGRRQAEKFGAVFINEDVVEISRAEDGGFIVELEAADVLSCKALILAMGISRNRLNVSGEKEFLGKGVSYCVECDANFYRGQPVVVVGNESAALHGALHLLLIAREVHLVYDDFQVTDHLRYQVERSDIQKHPGRKIKEIVGREQVEAVVLDNGERIETGGVFIELGAKGALQLASKLDIALDADLKHIAVNKKQETNIPGAFAAGDICGPPWQMAKAVGEGCVAGLEAALYAKRHSEKKTG